MKKPRASRSADNINIDRVERPKKSSSFHPRNQHKDGYDFAALVADTPALAAFVRPNPYGNPSIDFANPDAVKTLNLALLRLHYQLQYWDIPNGFLCPPIPGRVDYIHHVADLLTETEKGKLARKDKLLTGPKVAVLDIGTGANGVYPLLGVQSYGWRFVASDIDPISVANVENIVAQNPSLQGKVALRLQTNQHAIFKGVINAGERFDLTLCNPPFHASLAKASAGTERKIKNLAANRQAKGHTKNSAKNLVEPKLNFGGQKAELWCEGGEQRFLKDMIKESGDFSNQCLWFTSLVSKKENLKPCYQALKQEGAITVKTIEMVQGNKLTRVLAWSFLTPAQRTQWHKYRR